MIVRHFPKIGRLDGFVAIAQNGSNLKIGRDEVVGPPHNGIPVTLYGIFRVQAPSPREQYDVVEIIVGNGYIEPTGKTWHAGSVEEARGMVPGSHTLQFPATESDHESLVETWA